MGTWLSERDLSHNRLLGLHIFTISQRVDFVQHLFSVFFFLNKSEILGWAVFSSRMWLGSLVELPDIYTHFYVTVPDCTCWHGGLVGMIWLSVLI